MNNLKILKCNGCKKRFIEKRFLSEDGYCKACQYELEAKQDHKTDRETDYE